MPRSSLSSSSSPFPRPTSWTKKLMEAHGQPPLLWPPRSELSTGSDLTEENLHEHNRRQAIINARNSKCSPYYKGLTNQSLAIGQQSLSVSSPGRESGATTMRTSSTSHSSSMVKMKEWRSRFNKNNKRMKEEQPASYHRPVTGRNKKTTTLPKEMGVKSVSSPDLKDHGSSQGAVVVVNNNEKPLRERVSEPESKQTLPRMSNVKSKPKAQVGDRVLATRIPYQGMVESDDKVLEAADQSPNLPDINGFMSNKDKEASADNMVVEKEFVWATKYRPKALKDFICNRDKALSLQGPKKHGDCGHFIFEGPPGVGKRTTEHFPLEGPQRDNIISEIPQEIQQSRKGKQVESVTTTTSGHHISPSLTDHEAITDLRWRQAAVQHELRALRNDFREGIQELKELMEARVNNLKTQVRTDIHLATLATANVKGKINQLSTSVEQRLNQLSCFSLIQVLFPPAPSASSGPSVASAPPANQPN